MEIELVLILAPLALALVRIIFLTLRSKGNGDAENVKLPPGTKGWPFIGHTIAFMQPHLSASLGPLVDQNIAKHGRIFRLNLMGKPTIVSADAGFNRYILQGDDRMFEISCPTSIQKIMGPWSMLKVTGDLHREMRSVAVRFVSNLKLRVCFLPDIQKQVISILGSWREGVSFSAHDESKKFSFDLMVRYLMSMETGMPETEELRMDYNTFMKGMASLPLNLPGTAYRKAIQSRSRILRIMGQKLDERVENVRKEHEGLAEEDFVDMVVAQPNLTRDQMLDLMLGMLFAAHETSRSAISLAIYFLESCPKALQQLREEHASIARTMKEKDEIWLTWDYYRQMEFTHCVINETLRLGNVIKYLHRKTIRNVHYKGYDIPCGWEVIPIISAAHLDSTIFEDPQTYNPWRWQMISTATSKNSNITTFGGGPRLCPGADLAKVEIAVFLHHLIQKFNWELADNDCPVSLPFLGFPKQLPIRVHSIEKRQP